jgi:putative DNA primase/helicase
MFENFAKLIFVTNELPRTMDKTLAFYRRVRIIKFPYLFEGTREDKLLKDKITMEELEGLAFKCIPLLHKMMARNFTFMNDKRTEDVAEEYEKMSNPINTFIKKHCEYYADGSIAKTDFKEKLDIWLRATKQRGRVDNQIAQHMKETGIDDRKITFAGVRKNAWVGIRWKE